MYAGDLVFLAPTIHKLQRVLRLCAVEMEEMASKFITQNSVDLPTWKNMDSICCVIKMNNEIIPWARSATYLGIYIMAASKVKCSFNKAKAKFYRTLNVILVNWGVKETLV